MRRSAEGIAERLERSVAHCFQNERQHHVSVTVALSGGIDSVVLLELARGLGPRLGMQIRALHVNHGLSAHADRWERFCRRHCDRRRIPFECVRVQVGGDGANIEANARSARYAAFARAGAGLVALAHTQDDQAETLLLQLLRGAGVRGLSAMPARRVLDPGDARRSHAPRSILVRPLLEITRRDVERYARRKRLRWIEDESNTEERFARNFLRAQILPRLERRFPNYRAALGRSSAHLAEAARLLDQLASIDGAGAVDGDRLKVAALQALEPARAANLLRAFLLDRGIQAPSTVRLQEMLRQLCSKRADAQPQLALDAFALRRFRGWIELSRQPALDTRAAAVAWNGQSRVPLADQSELSVRTGHGRGVSRMKLSGGTLTIRTRQGGERMRLDAKRPRRTLKNLLQEAGVRPWLRDRMPLLFRDGELVWAPGIGVAWNFRAHGSEPSLLFSWNGLASPPRDK